MQQRMTDPAAVIRETGIAASDAPTWRACEDGGAYLREPIVENDVVHVMPRVSVDVEILGNVTVRLTAPEARGLARVLNEAADRIDAGEGFAR
jgi:hypothetical protein